MLTTTLLLTVALMTQPSPAPVTMAQGSSSQMADATQVVARTATEWNTLWTSHAGPEPVPMVDFSKEMLAAVFLGTRPTGGFSVEITGTRREADTLIIEYAERRPAANAMLAQVLTSPFHIVRLPRHAGPVRFEAAR